MNGVPPNVSGEPQVVLPGEAMIRLVRAAASVASASLGQYAIIGGVAVSARLNQAHRATTDLDAVVDDSTPPSAIHDGDTGSDGKRTRGTVALEPCKTCGRRKRCGVGWSGQRGTSRGVAPHPKGRAGLGSPGSLG
jgi:hypothetical protein